MLPNSDSESGGSSNNNLYQGPAEKTFSADNIPNGMGLSKASSLKAPFETFPGSEASEWAKMKEREIARFNALSPAMGLKVPITNAGIVLNIVDAGYGQGGAKPAVQGGALK